MGQHYTQNSIVQSLLAIRREGLLIALLSFILQSTQIRPDDHKCQLSFIFCLTFIFVINIVSVMNKRRSSMLYMIHLMPTQS